MLMMGMVMMMMILMMQDEMMWMLHDGMTLIFKYEAMIIHDGMMLLLYDETITMMIMGNFMIKMMRWRFCKMMTIMLNDDDDVLNYDADVD